MAPRSCDNRYRYRLTALLAAATLAMPLAMPSGSTVAAPARASESSPAKPATASTGFSELAELTPANVRGLMPLVVRSAAVSVRNERLAGQQQPSQRQLQVDAAASVDLRLQRFVEARVPSELATEHPVNLAPLGSAISYVPGSRGPRAWDPAQQRVLWRVRDGLPGASRMLVTAGGLVFYVTRDGWLKALDARTGRELWRHRVPGAKLDEVSSYRGPDGHQYIAVRSTPDNLPGQGEREEVLVFALAH